MAGNNLLPFISSFEPLPSPEQQLRDAMISASITPPESIIMDGQLRRYDDVKQGGDALWYVAFNDNIPGGAFGSWRSGTSVSWRGNTGQTYTPLEEMQFAQAIADARNKAETDRVIRNELAADNCRELWDTFGPASPDHPYLLNKGIQPHSARVNGKGELVIPMYIDGAISSLQTISRDGSKLFHKGGRVKGASVSFGTPGEMVYVAEGFATAATIYEETGVYTVATFSANNIPNVVEVLRSDASLSITIVADNDASGTGQNYANQAAAKYGARVIMPPTLGMDVNDYRASGGDVGGLLSPASESWLIHAPSFASQPSPIKWLVKHWIQSDAMIMVHGPSGSGKTFIVLDWVLNLASGNSNWFGNTLHPAPVVYLAGEGHNGLRSRIAAWMQINNKTPTNLWLSKSGCDLNTPLGLQKAITNIRTLPVIPGLIVIDTLHRFLSGDENSAMDTKTMLDACAVIQSTFSCSTLLVHHTGVSEDAQQRARGSSAWKGALDIEISIQPSGEKIGIVQKKSKDAELAPDIFVSLDSVTLKGWIDEDGEPVKSAIIIPTEAPNKRDKKNDSAIHSFRNAWSASGQEDRDGRPYVSRSAWLRSMVENDGLTESVARQHLKPSDEKRFVGKLVTSGVIELVESGFVVIDPSLSGQLMLSRC